MTHYHQNGGEILRRLNLFANYDYEIKNMGSYAYTTLLGM